MKIINRRDFLTRFSALPIVAALVEPVTRTIFLPPRGGWIIGVDPFDKYFTSNTAWFLKGGEGIPLYNRAHPDEEYEWLRSELPSWWGSSGQ